jgi:hypothetical protein
MAWTVAGANRLRSLDKCLLERRTPAIAEARIYGSGEEVISEEVIFDSGAGVSLIDLNFIQQLSSRGVHIDWLKKWKPDISLVGVGTNVPRFEGIARIVLNFGEDGEKLELVARVMPHLPTSLLIGNDVICHHRGGIQVDSDDPNKGQVTLRGFKPIPVTFRPLTYPAWMKCKSKQCCARAERQRNLEMSAVEVAQDVELPPRCEMFIIVALTDPWEALKGPVKRIIQPSRRGPDQIASNDVLFEPHVGLLGKESSVLVPGALLKTTPRQTALLRVANLGDHPAHLTAGTVVGAASPMITMEHAIQEVAVITAQCEELAAEKAMIGEEIGEEDTIPYLLEDAVRRAEMLHVFKQKELELARKEQC